MTLGTALGKVTAPGATITPSQLITTKIICALVRYCNLRDMTGHVLLLLINWVLMTSYPHMA